MVKEKLEKKNPTIACCGLDCALCPTYYTQGPSRCPGCCGNNFFKKHPSCSILTCCVKTKNYETCAECEDFPCSKINKWNLGDSFISHKMCLVNLHTIKKEGIEKFLKQQKRRIEILERLLDDFNDGRSKSFYCLSAALLSILSLEKALKSIDDLIIESKYNNNDEKSKSKAIKVLLNQFAKKENLELRLRKK